MALSWYAVPVQPTPQEPPPVRPFDIPAGPLATVVEAFERETGIHVTFATPDIGTVRSPGVSGLLTPADALAQLLTGTGVGYTFTTPLAVALEVEGVAESIDVTATQPRVASARYARPVSETPQTIQVIPRQVMEAQGVTTLSEALRNVPGISLQAGEGGGASSTTGDMFNLRGFSANNSLFVDGVRDDGLISRDVFNLEQVEVFMGPTGTDVGRGTAAGYVNMTTKTPARAVALCRHGRRSARPSRSGATVDLNQALPFGEAGSWWRGTAVRLNALVAGQRRARPRSRRARDAAPSRRRSRSVSAPTRASPLGGQFVEQDNLPGLRRPGRGLARRPAHRRRAASPRARSTQDNYYGSPDHDYDARRRTATFGRLEHDLGSSLQLRNQIRYNQTHRDGRHLRDPDRRRATTRPPRW